MRPCAFLHVRAFRLGICEGFGFRGLRIFRDHLGLSEILLFQGLQFLTACLLRTLQFERGVGGRGGMGGGRDDNDPSTASWCRSSSFGLTVPKCRPGSVRHCPRRFRCKLQASARVFLQTCCCTWEAAFQRCRASFWSCCLQALQGVDFATSTVNPEDVNH